ncbi:hypothetical protein [Defluviimonas salinarum]|uniref:Uncharacterized protein n=1 Tax=Defluviimonas salinarum TaxID=2992147 RepID=A0ABT3J8C5_9RHOB|nr:hypothetical protein [Defluviimonas salinarum]MCW3783929.1 hypothetical protein [Defluviimonas salinarum]
MSDEKKDKRYVAGYEDYRNPDHIKNAFGEFFRIGGDETYWKGAKAGREDRLKYGRTDTHPPPQKRSGTTREKRARKPAAKGPSSAGGYTPYRNASVGDRIIGIGLLLAALFVVVQIATWWIARSSEANRLAEMQGSTWAFTESDQTPRNAFFHRGDRIVIQASFGGTLKPSDRLRFAVTFPHCSAQNCQRLECPLEGCILNKVTYDTKGIFPGQPGYQATEYPDGTYTLTLHVNKHEISRSSFKVYRCDMGRMQLEVYGYTPYCS